MNIPTEHQECVKIYDIIPVPKPRMTQRDKWAKRKCVTRYFEFKDRCNELGINIKESGNHITFYMPMPISWSNKKKSLMDNKPHQQRPDIDNLLKAIFDAVMKEDCVVWDCRSTKIWSFKGRIEVCICQ